jgi:hypothetical protein
VAPIRRYHSKLISNANLESACYEDLQRAHLLHSNLGEEMNDFANIVVTVTLIQGVNNQEVLRLTRLALELGQWTYHKLTPLIS